MSDLLTLKKRILKKLNDANSLVTSNYPPALSGQNAIDFDTAAQDAGNDSNDILLDSFFAGITPVSQPQPTTATMIQWFVDMAEEAAAVIDKPLPTPADKQNAADCYYTISQDRGNLISEYTT